MLLRMETFDLRRDSLLHSIEVFNNLADEELSQGGRLCDRDLVASYTQRLDSVRKELNALTGCLGEGDTLASQLCNIPSLSLASAGHYVNTACCACTQSM